MKYSINLVRTAGSESGKHEIFEHLGFILSNLIYIILFIVLGYSGQKLYHFHSAVQKEEALLERLNNYSLGKIQNRQTYGYKELKQLQSLESGRILWSLYLDTIQAHLPPGFLLTDINFQGDSLTLSGTGSVSAARDPVKPVQKITERLNGNARFNQKFSRLILNSLSINALEQTNHIQFVLKTSER